MSLPDDAQRLIEEEEQTLVTVMQSLREQFAIGTERYQMETARARDLTAQIVNARRDVDKQMLASDEAVSHSLSEAKREELRSIDRLLDKPYFARIVLEEDKDGRPYEIEYKLGTAANTDCRIIDWRRAPIAKLYYEYKEGEEYCELIQGRERNGIIKTRNKLGISSGILERVSCRYGDFFRTDKGWSGTVREPGQATGERQASEYGALRNILSLITPEQFRTITEDAETAVLIQGIAGSGKTTVALHRLAWLLHEDNSDIKPKEALVLVLSRAFKRYVRGVLPQLAIENVDVLTYFEWTQWTLRRLFGPDTPTGVALRRERIAAHPGVRRVKRSPALLVLLESHIAEGRLNLQRPLSAVLDVLAQPNKFLEHDRSGLLDRELVQQAAEHTRACLEHDTLDTADDALLLRIAQVAQLGTFRKDGTPLPYRHVVADEIQDFSPVELETILASVQDASQLTLVGDTHQQLGRNAGFPGWEALRAHPELAEAGVVFSSLTVSHRSTLPIMRLADHVAGNPRTTEGRPGKAPIWFKCRQENEGVRQAIQWLGRVLERFPGTLAAVVCRTLGEAKHVQSLLEPTFGSAVRYGDDDTFTFEEGIVVTDVRRVKGLEFPNVLIWNPDARSYPAREQSRNMLYVAMTRAEELLCIVTWGEASPLLPPVTSKLVRGFEPDAIEEDDSDD
ncbi:MAG: ATP-binding domain-containing protein [Bdellovibrionales bacterium]|nr:ATP-binding domain-containing protein [Bdellovibrionales bacterium]